MKLGILFSGARIHLCLLEGKREEHCSLPDNPPLFESG